MVCPDFYLLACLLACCPWLVPVLFLSWKEDSAVLLVGRLLPASFCFRPLPAQPPQRCHGREKEKNMVQSDLRTVSVQYASV